MNDINYILEMIPHRYPFLMVDKVMGKKDKSHIQTIKNVTINEPYFSGHFPEKPIMPGVLILESMAQSACLIILDYIDNPKNHLVYLAKVSDFRILRNVIPGDQIIIDAKVVHEKMNSFKFHSTCKVNNQLVAKAEFIATLVNK
ncbi:MAG: 3-hydroxyacyl-ACP dehydratase FabZ [Flammeovirgaceae bacterium TMED290]|nr:MAG: 3-hydroxyacyl-ACP dehydratase FabZ [Flammeovirgaceae bacterium TMED290]|tara:strand:+ start:776 stop:1207 length:432 start_codon:yes stop_codon:yes gene_type:complete